MKSKLVVVVSCLVLAAPAMAQIFITPTPNDDQTRPRRGFISPEEQQRLEERDQLQQDQQGRMRAPTDYNTPRQYEGRASFSGTRSGKCPLSGSVRATVRGNTIDASLTFPIERDAIHGYISGSRFEAKGTFGYFVQGSVNEFGINGTAVKKSQMKPSPQPRAGAPVPFIPGPSVSREPPPPPIVQDCAYTISLSRVS